MLTIPCMRFLHSLQCAQYLTLADSQLEWMCPTAAQSAHWQGRGGQWPGVSERPMMQSQLVVWLAQNQESLVQQVLQVGQELLVVNGTASVRC